MGDKYPILTPREIIQKLESFGFKFKSQKGSHLKHVKYGTPTKIVIIPNHDTVAKGTLKSILDQVGIELDDFLNK